MGDLMRDQALLSVFTNHLHSTGALSVPPEDLNVAIEEVSERFSAIEEMVGGNVPYDKEEPK
jgi:hypothetical protein